MCLVKQTQSLRVLGLRMRRFRQRLLRVGRPLLGLTLLRVTQAVFCLDGAGIRQPLRETLRLSPSWWLRCCVAPGGGRLRGLAPPLLVASLMYYPRWRLPDLAPVGGSAAALPLMVAVCLSPRWWLWLCVCKPPLVALDGPRWWLRRLVE